MIEKTYRKSSDKIVSYDWQTSLEQQGYISYYPLTSYTDAARAYHLSSETLSSFDDTLTITNTDTLTFTSPMLKVNSTVRGQIIVSGYYEVAWTSGTGVFTITLEKYDGTTATTIGSGYSQTFNNDVSKTDFVFVFNATETALKSGDYLRVKVAWVATDANLVIYTQPTDSTSRIQVNIPFKVIE